MNENVTSIHVTTVETLVYQSKISYINTVKPTFEVSMVKGRFEHGTEGNPKWRLCTLEVTEHERKSVPLFFILCEIYSCFEDIYIYIYIYTGCPGRNVPDFGRVFLMLNYTDMTQNTYIQS